MRLLTMLTAAAVLAGCSAASSPSGQPAANASAGSAGSGQCNEPCVIFNLQVNFSGLDSLQGSFVDNDSGTGYSSCADFAKGDSVGFVQGPGTPTQTTTTIAGKSLSFLFTILHDKFHGPGTYVGVLAGGAVNIGTDTFLGTDSTETLNADGSGNASFSNLSGGSASGAQGTESGTVTWTCSK
ncbi:MAG TPA: hypothetical protein VF383_07610 [Candidatus Dormibacteraeota bacterium]